ncbi:MAG: ABC transporter ATP-binding protein [Spirochaetes bacterium]|nr:ABC transporter ATP-binding protein [Spirochaetota bacterium]
MNIIEVDKLAKYFTYKKGKPFRKKKVLSKAVDGVSFSIKQGEIFSLLGPNGAGKTTTIKMLATLLLPLSGRASVKGFDIVKNDHDVRRVLTAVLPGERTLFWKLNVRENLHYFGSLYGLKRSYVNEKYNELLKFFGIEDKRDTLVEKLSTGERQKVVLSRALLPDPEVVLLDEPTLGLDPVAAISLRQMIKKIAGKGKTILLTTHYMYEADELSSRVAIINKGKIVCLDHPSKLKQSLAAKKIVRITTNTWNDSINGRFIEKFNADAVDMHRRNEEFHVNFKCGRSLSMNDITDFLSENGVKASNMSLDEPSLEDVFIEKTGKSIEEEEVGSAG